jgi:hypothetical protein
MFPVEIMEHYAARFGLSHTSERHKRNLVYSTYAVRCLTLPDGSPDPRFAWVLPAPGARRWHITVLAELGQFGNTAVIRELAETLCDMEPKPTLKQACATLRSYRRGLYVPPFAGRNKRKAATGSVGGLKDAIVRAAERYLRSHPGMTKANIESAFNWASRGWT